MPYLIAIDPGGTTGMAIRRPDGKISTYRVQTQEAIWDWFLPDEPKFDHVILEEWQYFDGVARPEGVHTAELVASLKGICYIRGIPLALKTPSARYSRMPEAIDWYCSERKRTSSKTFSKMESHEIDALAHLLSWEAQDAGKQRPRR